MFRLVLFFYTLSYILASSGIAHELTNKIMPIGVTTGSVFFGGTGGAEVAPEGSSEFFAKAWRDSTDWLSAAQVEVRVREAQERERLKAAEVLHHVWLYDEEADSRAAVDASDKYSFYGSGRTRCTDELLPVYGRDYAEVVCPDVADDPWAAIERYLPSVADEGRREGYWQAFEQLKYAGNDKADDYYGLLGRMVRDEVRWRYAEKQKLITTIKSALKSSTESITWKDFLLLVEKQETRYNQKLTLLQKRNIYEQLIKNILEEKQKKQVEEKARKQKEKEKIYKGIGILAGCSLCILFVFVAYKKRYIIYRFILPSLHPFPLLICALLAIAIFELPSGYYQFLHIAVTIWGIINITHAYHTLGASPKKNYVLLITGGITILYNPIFPIHLDEDIWHALNIISIPLIFLSNNILKSTQAKHTNSIRRNSISPTSHERNPVCLY